MTHKNSNIVTNYNKNGALHHFLYLMNEIL
jgi:hypothetical protein